MPLPSEVISWFHEAPAYPLYETSEVIQNFINLTRHLLIVT